MASRVCASLLTALNTTELIASSLKGYEDIAVKLALDAGFRSRVVAKLRAARESAPLWRPQHYVKRLESALGAMWAQYLTGRPPRTLNVGDASVEGDAGEGSALAEEEEEEEEEEELDI